MNKHQRRETSETSSETVIRFRSANNIILATRNIKGFSLNQQLVDLGLPRQYANDTERVTRLIEKIDSDFDIVLIAERIEESFVLLADLLCLPLFVFASLKVNARKPENKVIKKPLN